MSGDHSVSAITAQSTTAPARSPDLYSLCYRSRGHTGLSGPEVEALVAQARQRNASQEITGQLVFDTQQRRFFQWLEGPRAAIERIWSSIRRDPRHGDIDVLGAGPAPVRFFSDWGLQLVMGDVRDTALPEMTAAILQALDQELLSPLISRFHAEALERRGQDLASLLLAQDQAGAERFIDTEYAHCPSLLDLYADLFEPAARSLGDRWSQDLCTEVDLTLALGQLAAKAHRLASDIPTRVPCDCRVVLCTPPGETHLLGSAMLGELMWLQGCEIELETRSATPMANRLAPELMVVCTSPALNRGLRSGWQEILAPAARSNGRCGVYGRMMEDGAAGWTGSGADFAHDSLREAYRCCCAFHDR